MSARKCLGMGGFEPVGTDETGVRSGRIGSAALTANRAARATAAKRSSGLTITQLRT